MKKTAILNTMNVTVLFALPIILTGIVNILSSFIGMMMVARLGPAPLAAGALATTTFMTIITVTATIFYAVGLLISHHIGQEKNDLEIGVIVKNALWVAILLSLPAVMSRRI